MQPGSLRSYEGMFRKFSHGFRPLTPEERARITELRLRLAHGAPGREPGASSRRARSNQWDPAYTAVANGLAPGAPLAPGALIKIAVREPYVSPRSAPDATSPAPPSTPQHATAPAR